MRHGITIFLCFTIASVATAADIKHRWVCVDNGANRLIHVDQNDSSKNWSIPVPGGSRDLQLLSDGKLLLSHGNGAAEYRLADGKRLPWVVDRYRSVQTARRLPDGNTLLATVSGTLYEVDPQGKEIGKEQIAVKGLNMRLMRVLPSGNLLIGSAGP